MAKERFFSSKEAMKLLDEAEREEKKWEELYEKRREKIENTYYYSYEEIFCKLNYYGDRVFLLKMCIETAKLGENEVFFENLNTRSRRFYIMDEDTIECHYKEDYIEIPIKHLFSFCYEFELTLKFEKNGNSKLVRMHL